MARESRIQFNPTTGELEIEGTEKFVKTYFSKLQQLMFGEAGAAPEKGEGRKKPRKAVARKSPRTTPKKASKPKIKKAGRTRVRKPSVVDMIVKLIQESDGGLSTKDLKEKTGLQSRQIWTSIYRALKLGTIQKARRGLYVKA